MEKNKPKRLTFAVPTRNRTDALLMCLMGIENQTYKDWDIVIVDDNEDNLISQCAAITSIIEDMLKNGHLVKIIPVGEKKTIFPVHNIALRAAETELIMKLDDDLVLDPNFVEPLIGLFNDSKVGVASGCMRSYPVFYNDIDGLGKNLLRFYKTGNGYRWKWDVDLQFYLHKEARVYEVEHINSSYIYRRSALMDIGGFNEDLCDGEETIPQVKMALKGYKILLYTGVTCLHFRNKGGWRKSPRKLNTQKNLESNLGELFGSLNVEDGDTVHDIIKRNGL